MNWGIEGEHYDVKDGKRVIPEDVQDRKVNDNASFTKESGIGLYNSLFLVTVTARWIRPEIIIRPTSQNKLKPTIRHPPKKR